MPIPPKVTLPPNTMGVVYFLDEAGSKGTMGDFFVTAAVRTTDPDRVSRKVKAVRDRHGFTKPEEIKFGDVTKNTAGILAEVFREIVNCDCTFGAFVLDKRHFDPWEDKPQWQGHLFATDRLLRGLVSRREVSIALMDHIDVPQGVSYGNELMTSLNSRFHNKRIVAAVSLDSRTCPGLQIADLLASSIFYTRKKIEEMGLEGFLACQTPKARLARDIATCLGSSYFADCDTDVLRVATSHAQPL